MISPVLFILVAASTAPKNEASPQPSKITLHRQGLHGYIGFHADPPPAGGAFGVGVGFYSAVWPLIDRPLANLQIGLASTWILPDNSDNNDRPLAPVGTLARTWPERGPTWGSVFQTVEGGLGYWAGNHFRYGPPKFSMNATPQCYDYEIGSPGWSFFYSNEALPDERLGIAQLSNRLLIPPDGLPFAGHPNGEFLGYAWMALPFTEASAGEAGADPADTGDAASRGDPASADTGHGDATGDDTSAGHPPASAPPASGPTPLPPTGEQSWTCFLSAANFKGPIAYYIPETWSKIGGLFGEPFLYGRGLDARPGVVGGGAMEINTVPRFDAADRDGVVYSKLPRLQFPVDAQGRTLLVQDVTYYARAALYDAFRAWRDGGPACSGRFEAKGALRPRLAAVPTRYDQAGKEMVGIDRVFDNRVFDGNAWGLVWADSAMSPKGVFPQYFKQVEGQVVAVAPEDVPAETRLREQEFAVAGAGAAYTSPRTGAWSKPGPKSRSFTAELADGSVVTYAWYRFVDQPSFQQYRWSEAKKARLQALVERIHASWPIDRDYMAPPARGTLVTLDPALIVTPPQGMEVGFVPIVTGQSAR